MGDLVMDEDRPFLPSFAAPLSNPDPDSIRAVTWELAEDPAREVLDCIHPTLDSDERRSNVLEYVQRLIRRNLQLEGFPYGSVPLKTYLPDGDIDLTVLSTPNLDAELPHEVLRVLKAEEKNENSEFELKDTQFIDADVKLVKCIVRDIVVDISCNQLGGLITLCFLEQVDRLAGKDHLFKRSIILIKAWCYYESRILGAHHGLISTYALETLVLYIFHVFHASLDGPLQVLYRFLDYYAKFDWDNYCVSLDGPVSKSSLPNLPVETRENEGNLLGAEFRKNCIDMFMIPSRGSETEHRAFTIKNLNIIDPLKENNNLGRSVNKGNYFRIRSAFRYGARRLGKILKQSDSKIKDEIKMFFRNTLQRHNSKDGPGSALNFPANEFGTLSISSRSEPSFEDDSYSRFSNGDFEDYMNEHNALEREYESVDVKTGLELLIEAGGSELVDGDTICFSINKDSFGNSSDKLSFDVKEKDATDDSSGETERLHPFSDLTGDYDAHVRNLLYGQKCHGYTLSTASVWASPSSAYGNTNLWATTAATHSRPVPFQQNLGSKVNANGVVIGQPKDISGSNRNPGNVALRGTGPYIPVMSGNAGEDRSLPTRGRGWGRGPPVSNGYVYRGRAFSGEAKSFPEANHATRSPLEWSPRRAHVNDNVPNQSHQHPSQGNSTANGLRKLEFGTFRSMPENENLANTEASPPVQSPKGIAYVRKPGRTREDSFHLKNEEEFPPLSS